MEVRIRHADDATARVLADVTFRPEVIDQIIPTLGSWGVLASDGNMFDTDGLIGQFVDDGERTFFEIVVGGD